MTPSYTVTGPLIGSPSLELMIRDTARKEAAERDTEICRNRTIEGYRAGHDFLHLMLSGGVLLEVYCDEYVVEWKISKPEEQSLQYQSFNDVCEQDSEITLIYPSEIENRGGKSRSTFSFMKSELISRLSNGKVRMLTVLEYWFFIAVDDYEYMFSSLYRFDSGTYYLLYGET